MNLKLFYLLCWILFTASAGYSQVYVTVNNDETGVALPGSHIHIMRNGKTVKTFVTNRQGKAQIPVNIIGDSCMIFVTYLGFDSEEQTVFGSDQKNEVFVRLKPKANQLNEAVVTGQYSMAGVEDAVQNIKVISREKMDNMAAVSLADVLQNELNIRLNQDAALGTFMTMQGISGDNVKLLMDGVPIIGRLDGNIDLSQINLQNIERIEIVRGPLSVNYGTNALAGTINLITKSGNRKNNGLQLGSYLENVGTVNVFGEYHYHNNNHIVQASGGRNFFSGWSADDTFWPGFEQPVADVSRTSEWNPRTQYFADASYAYKTDSSRVRYSSRYFNETITNRGMPRSPYFETAFDEYFYTTRIDNALDYNQTFKKNGKFNFIAAYNYFRRDRETYFTDLTDMNRVKVDIESGHNADRFDLFNIRGVYSAPLTDQLHVEGGIDVNIESAEGPRIEEGTSQIGDYAAFTTAEYSPVKNVTLRPGIRYAYNTLFTPVPLPSFNLLWKPSKRFSVRTSYARGFRAPTLKELFFFFVDINHNIRGNSDLSPETSHNYAGSLRYKKVNNNTVWQAEGSVFYNDINDLITLAQVTGDEFSYVNVGRFRTTGAELSGSLFVKQFKFTSGITYTGRDQGITDETGLAAFAFYPEWQLNITKSWKEKGITLSLFHKYQGELPGFALSGEEVVSTLIESYSMTDFTATKNLFNKRLNISAGVKNIFNVMRVNVVGTGSSAHSVGARSAPVGMGRMAFLRLNYKIKSLKNEEWSRY